MRKSSLPSSSVFPSKPKGDKVKGSSSVCVVCVPIPTSSCFFRVFLLQEFYQYSICLWISCSPFLVLSVWKRKRSRESLAEDGSKVDFGIDLMGIWGIKYW
jgi:hypothetical protein